MRRKAKLRLLEKMKKGKFYLKGFFAQGHEFSS
jgi:hypothetical protein